MNQKIYLIDLSALIFRAFYAVRPLSAPDGTPTNALFGLMSTLIKIIKSEKPELMVYALDQKEPSFRKDIYPDYKANRSEMPEDLVPQMALSYELCANLGGQLIGIPKFEADDIIGSLCKKGLSQGFEVIIVSGDKDFAQLLAPGVTLFDPFKESKITIQNVSEKWGVDPKLFTDYLGMVGDASDNIPGVPGVGPKTAEKILAQWGGLDEIYKNIESIKPDGLKQKLIDNKDKAYLSKQLATIECLAPVPWNLDAMKFPNPQPELNDFFVKLNFQSFLKNPELSSMPGVQVSEPLMVNADHGEFVFWLGSGDTFYDQNASEVRPNSKIPIVGFDLKRLLHLDSIYHKNILIDLQLMAYSLHSDHAGSWRVCSSHFLGIASEQPSLLEIRALFEKLKLELENNNLAKKCYEQLDAPLLKILFKMEEKGILLDRVNLAQQSEENQKDLALIETQIREQSGSDFNIQSPKQLAVVLYTKLNLPILKKTKNWSLN